MKSEIIDIIGSMIKFVPQSSTAPP